MHSPLKPLIRTLVSYLLSVLAIAVVLAAGAYVVKSVQAYRVSSEDRQALAAVRDEVGRYRQGQAAQLAERLGAARDLPLQAVERRIGELTRTLQAAAPGIDLQALLRAGPEQYAGRLASHYKTALERELAAQELAYLQQLRAHLVILTSRTEAQRELERLHRVHSAAYERYMTKRQEADRLGYVDRQLLKKDWTVTPALSRLAGELAALRMDNQRAAAAWRAQTAALERIGRPGAPPAFALDGAALERAVQPLDALVDEVDGALSAHPVSRIAALLLPALPAAAGILLLCLAGRFALRVFLYFVLAPLAARRAPLRLDGEPAGAGTGEGAALLAPSAVSQAIRLEADEELLVLPPYLHSTPVAAQKSTRWLLKGRWWTALVSGMALLTCVRTGRPDEQVLLSAGDGGVSELALLQIPAGSALAFQPRALVGLVCGRGAALQLEQHWRLASLHAWLTLQWRYFVVRGPVTLVLQGTRGVRVQQADGARLVRPSSTLGFSSEVAYSTLRSAPFLPYLQGQTHLLYDRFAGTGGIVIHDATPDLRARGGRVKRGIEGLSDAVLKLFGL